MKIEKIAQRRTKGRSSGSEGRNPLPPTSPETLSKTDAMRPHRGGVAALGGVSVRFRGAFGACPLWLSVALCGAFSAWVVCLYPYEVKTPCGAFCGFYGAEGKRIAPDTVPGLWSIATNGGGASDLPTTAHGRQVRRGRCRVCGSTAGASFPGLGSSRSRTGAGSPLLWC